MNQLIADVRFGLRMLRKDAALSAFIVLLLAFGVGVNTAIFSYLDGSFFGPLSIGDPSRLMHIFTTTEDIPHGDTSYPNYLDIEKDVESFSDVLAYTKSGAVVEAGGETKFLPLSVVSQNYFGALGVAPAAGRTLTPNESELEAVAGYGFARLSFGSAENAVGKTIRLNGQTAVIIGVMPRLFRGLDRYMEIAIWIPVSRWQIIAPSAENDLTRRDSPLFQVVGRLRQDRTPELAATQVEALSRRIAESYPGTAGKWRLTSELEERIGTRRSGGQRAVLMGIGVLVMLICCANIGCFLITKSKARAREFSIRRALGATGFQILAQQFIEIAVLAALGGIGGVALAFWFIELLPALLPVQPLLVSYDYRLDARALAYALACSLLTLFLVGLLPILLAPGNNLVPLAKDETSESRRSSWWRLLPAGDILSAVQIAVCLVLLIDAALLAISLRNSVHRDLGFNWRQQMLLVDVAPDISGYTDERTRTFYSELVKNLRVIPGVVDASFISRVPLSSSGSGLMMDVKIPGYERTLTQPGMGVRYSVLGPRCLSVLGITILRGRAFDEHDTGDSRNVLLINESMGRKFWPSTDPVGRLVRTGQSSETPRQVIGVVRDVIDQSSHEASVPEMYLPFTQAPVGEATLLVRSVNNPSALAATVRESMRNIAREVPALHETTLADHMRGAFYEDYVLSALSDGLSVPASILALAGLYALVSHRVLARRREIGIRIAIGAEEREIVSYILRRAVFIAIGGVSVGLPIALVTGKTLISFLHGVQAADPIVYSLVAAVLIAASAFAAYIPARRASRIPPVEALRYE